MFVYGDTRSTKAKGRFSRPFCFDGEEENESLCARCDRANKRYAYVASNASGVHLVQPIRSNAEDGVWVQTPLISTKHRVVRLLV